MSGGACVVAMLEVLKLEAPSPMLEQCLRQALVNPLVVQRVGAKSYIWQLGLKSQWGPADQRKVQKTLRGIVEKDMPHLTLPPAP